MSDGLAMGSNNAIIDLNAFSWEDHNGDGVQAFDELYHQGEPMTPEQLACYRQMTDPINAQRIGTLAVIKDVPHSIDPETQMASEAWHPILDVLDFYSEQYFRVGNVRIERAEIKEDDICIHNACMPGESSTLIYINAQFHNGTIFSNVLRYSALTPEFADAKLAVALDGEIGRALELSQE
ncbi:MAG: hypothetical protein ABII18_04120 [bacterium]|nr:hypothetical protein [bacterium]MBU1918299.1 hypothetical protein [bacterium]